jgi:hypothetical protein
MRASVFSACMAFLGVSILCDAALAQMPATPWDWQPANPSSKFPIYDPYAPGILPGDLNSELARVLREVDVIEARALAQWKATPPPVLSGGRAITRAARTSTSGSCITVRVLMRSTRQRNRTSVESETHGDDLSRERGRSRTPDPAPRFRRTVHKKPLLHAA